MKKHPSLAPRERTGRRSAGLCAVIRALPYVGCTLFLPAAAGADYGGWVTGSVGYYHAFVPYFQDATAPNDLSLTYTPPPLTAGTHPDADMEGHATSSALRGRVHAKYALSIGDLVGEYDTFALHSSSTTSYRQLLTISGGAGFDGQAATYTMQFALTGVGSSIGLIEYSVAYGARLYSPEHYFVIPGTDGAPDTTSDGWGLFGDIAQGTRAYDQACEMTIHGAILGQAVDVEVQLDLWTQAYVQKTWLPRSGEAALDFLNTAQLTSVTVQNLGGSTLAVFDANGNLVSGDPSFTMTLAIPEPGPCTLAAGLALFGFAVWRRNR